MPEPASREAPQDRRRWWRPGLSTQQLRLLVLIILALAVAAQVYTFIHTIQGEIGQVVKTIGQATAWRSANYGYSKNLADFVVFLQRRIPPEAKVLWPPPESDAWLPGATFMQVLLFPRQLLQCPTPGCESIQLDGQTFFVTAGKFPDGAIVRMSTGQSQFNQRWGVITFDPAGFKESDPLAQFRSISQAMVAALWPMAWLLLLATGGSLAVKRLLPQSNHGMQAALGFGLGAGLFTILAGLVALTGIPLRAPVVGLISAILLLTGIGVHFLGRKQTGGNNGRAEQRTQRRPRLDLWALLFVLLAAAAGMIAAGKGYRLSDELLIWAPKGYGIAQSGTLVSVTEWGTNTLPYPLLVPILIAGSNLLFSDILPAAKLVFSAYYLALLLLTYSYLVQTGLQKHLAGLSTLLVATAPLIFRHATIAYANLAFTFNLAAAVLTLARAGISKETRERRQVYLLSGLFFMLASWTRPEGVWMSWLLIMTAVGLKYFWQRRVIWEEWAWLVAPMVFYQVLWWLVSRSAYAAGVERSQIGWRAFSETLSGNWHLYEAVYILAAGASRLLNFHSWGAWGAGILLLAVAGLVWRKKSRPGERLVFIMGWLLVGMVYVMYYVASFDKNHDISWWVATGLERMLFPAVFLLWVGGIQSLFGRGENRIEAENEPEGPAARAGEGETAG